MVNGSALEPPVQNRKMSDSAGSCGNKRESAAGRQDSRDQPKYASPADREIWSSDLNILVAPQFINAAQSLTSS